MELEWPRNGATRRQELEHFAVMPDHRMSPSSIATLRRAGNVPASLSHIWRWFWELNASRKGSGFGPLPIGYDDVEAWQRITGAKPSYWELRTLKAMDSAYRKCVDDQIKIDSEARK